MTTDKPLLGWCRGDPFIQSFAVLPQPEVSQSATASASNLRAPGIHWVLSTSSDTSKTATFCRVMADFRPGDGDRHGGATGIFRQWTSCCRRCRQRAIRCIGWRRSPISKCFVTASKGCCRAQIGEGGPWAVEKRLPPRLLPIYLYWGLDGQRDVGAEGPASALNCLSLHRCAGSSRTTHLVRVDRVLDLRWLREDVLALSTADNGRPGIDPEVAVRVILPEFLLGIVHDRRFKREAQVNLVTRWFAGYVLHEALLDHSSLTRIRQCWDADRFRRISEGTVQSCIAAKNRYRRSGSTSMPH